jgi:hypothetical protein
VRPYHREDKYDQSIFIDVWKGHNVMHYIVQLLW